LGLGSSRPPSARRATLPSHVGPVIASISLSQVRVRARARVRVRARVRARARAGVRAGVKDRVSTWAPSAPLLACPR